MPLFHFVTSDLPSNTKAPELDDSNATTALRADASWSGVDASSGSGVTENLVGLYVSYLVTLGFLPGPSSTGVWSLPTVRISEDQRNALMSAGGRGGIS